MRALVSLGSVGLVVLLTVAVGCTKQEEDKPEDRPKEKFVSNRGGGGAVAAKLDPLKAASLDGVIKGRVVLEGTAPDMPFIAAMKVHNDRAVCLAGKEFEKRDQAWIVGSDNGVANVVVFLKPPAGKYFELKDEDKKRTDEVIIDQPHCAFIPHIAATYSLYNDGKEMQPSGQRLIVKNSAPFNHNVNWQGNKNPSGNALLPSGQQRELKLTPASEPVQLSCDIHSWMRARVWVFDHPYFFRTATDGTFEIKNVPTGVELAVVAWHEATGFFHGGKDGVKQTFKPGENTLDLKLAAK